MSELRQLTIRGIPREDYDQLGRIAHQRQRSISQLMRDLIRDAIARGDLVVEIRRMIAEINCAYTLSDYDRGQAASLLRVLERIDSQTAGG